MSPEQKAWRPLKRFDLFQRKDNEHGVWSAVDDILELIDEGAIYNVDEVLQAIDEVTANMEAGTSSNSTEGSTTNGPNDLIVPSSCRINVSSSDEVLPANILITPVRSSGSSSDVCMPAFSETEIEEVIPVGIDGLPDEDTISFLFDHVTQHQVASRAHEQPAYKKLAELRERVLARLNRENL